MSWEEYKQKRLKDEEERQKRQAREQELQARENRISTYNNIKNNAIKQTGEAIKQQNLIKQQQQQAMEEAIKQQASQVNTNLAITNPTTVTLPTSNAYYDNNNNRVVLPNNLSNLNLQNNSSNPMDIKNTINPLTAVKSLELNKQLDKGGWDAVNAALENTGNTFFGGVQTGVAGLTNALILPTAGVIDKLNKDFKKTSGLQDENALDQFKNYLLDESDKMTQNSKYFQERNSLINNEPLKTIGDVSGVIGNMAPSILSNVVAPGSGLLLTGLSAGGNSAQETLNKDRTNIDQALLTGILKGGVEAATEKITGGNLLTKGSLDDVVGKTIANKVKSTIGQKILSKGYEFTGEILEEHISDNAGYIIDKLINDKDLPDFKEWWNNASETTKTTFLSTAVLNLLGLGGNTYNELGKYKNDAQMNKYLNEAQKLKNQQNLPTQDKNVAPNQTQNAQNQVQQQTTLPMQKMAQNQTSEQIQPTNKNIVENLKNQAEKHIKEADISEYDKKMMLDALNNMQEFTSSDYRDVTNTLSEMQVAQVDTSNMSFEDVVDNAMNMRSYEIPSPLQERNIKTIGKETKVNAYQYDNPEVKPYYKEMAQILAEDITNISDKANRTVVKNKGTQLMKMTPEINELHNELGYSYNDILKGLNNIIEDHGAENNALSKKIEIVIDGMLRNGYVTSLNQYIKSNDDYINLINKGTQQKAESNLKQQQLDIIQKSNPMTDDYHTGIRDVNDIKTFEEAMQDDESFVYGDFTLEDAEKALKNGKVTVYSSQPIEPGSFVSTSQNMAKDYAGNGQIYSQEVNLDDVAWINGDEGQYAKTNNTSNQTNTLENRAQDDDLLNADDSITETRLPTQDNKQVLPTTEQNNLIEQSNKLSDKEVAKILTETQEKPKTKRSMMAFLKANLIDKGMVFEELSRKANNRDLQGKWDYTLTSEARGQYAIGNERLDSNGNVISKSLTDIIDEVGEDTADFYKYMYNQLNIDRMTLEDRFDGDTGINYERTKPIKNKPVFGESVTADISRNIVEQLEQQHPEFKEYAKDVYDYLDANTQELVDRGVISKETQALFKEMYPHYVPISRVDTKGNAVSVPLDTGRTGINNPIKRATGGSGDIQPMFNTIADRTLQTYRASARNSFGIELKNTLSSLNQLNEAVAQADIDEIIDSMSTEEQNEELLKKGEKGQNPTFTVFDKGNKTTYEITEDMYDALKPKNDLYKRLNDSKLSKGLTKFNNFRRGLLTEYNPVFSLTNAIKDAQDVLINSQHAAKTYAKVSEAYAQILKKGTWYKEYVQNGGEQNSYFRDGEFEQKKTTLPSKVKEVVKLPLNAISNINNVIEMSPRLAEYIASREQGRSIETSMLDAARVTTNFKAGGDFTKTLNRNGATFLNASVQGFQQQVRNIQEANAKGLKGYAVLATKYAIAGLPALLLNNLVWRDDEDYEQLQDYVKDNYYIIGKTPDGTFIRIPKGRAVATIQKIVSNVNDFIKDDKINSDDVGKAFWDDLKEDVSFAVDNLAPNNPLDNNIIAPITQAATNKTWYGSDLVPSRLKDKPAAEQYDETTDAISKWIGKTLNVSPVKVNYLLDQYSGGVGDVVLPMLTPQAENNAIEDKFTTNSTMKSKYPGEFFEKADELKVNNNSEKATDEDKLKYKYISNIQSDVSDLYKQKREIQNSDVSDTEKKKQLQEVQKQINDITKDALENVESIKISNDTAKIGDNEYYKYKDSWTKVTDKEKEKLNNVSLETYSDYKNSIEGLTSTKDKISTLMNQNISNKEKEQIYENFIGQNDNLYDTMKLAGTNINEYLKYKTQEFTSDKEDDGTTTGKSVSGSKKAKVVDYVQNMNITNDQKLLLLATQYSLTSSEKSRVANYVNSLKTTKANKLKIYESLSGFTVYKDGKVTWK